MKHRIIKFEERFYLIIKNRSTDLIILWLATFLLWVVTGPKSGMGYETSLINYSNDRGILQGFIFGDPLRPFTSASYHLANNFSNLIFNSRFFGIQIFFLILLGLRVQFFWMLLNKIFPSQRILCFLSGAFLTTYSADGATLWVGQMNQLSCSLAAIASLYFFNSLIERQIKLSVLPLASLALGLQFFSLWSYEVIFLPLSISGMFLIIKTPLKRFSKFLYLSFWLTLPLIYGTEFLTTMLTGPDSYRKSQISPGLTPIKFLKNLLYEHSVGLNPIHWFLSLNRIHSASWVTGLLISLGLIAYLYLILNEKNDFVSSPIPYTKLYAFILTLSTLIFFAFAGTTSATNLWRTHLIVAVPFSLFFASFFNSQFAFVKKAKCANIIFLSVLLFAAATTFIERGYKHESDWILQRNVAQSILKAAPCFQKHTDILLLLPKDSSTGGSIQSPFGDNMWFEEMLKLTYPNQDVKGIYISSEGVLAPGVNVSSLRNRKFVLIDGRNKIFQVVGPNSPLVPLPEELNLVPSSSLRNLQKCNSSSRANERYFG